MNITYVPLLQKQRDLYAIPRGFDRFKSYIAEIHDKDNDEMLLPLSAMNPMGKEHIPELLDRYLALDADGVAARAVADSAEKHANIAGDFQVTLVIADDLHGGWTNRYDVDFKHRFESRAYHRRGWITGMLWTSDAVSAEAARLAALTALFRAAHIQQHGYAKTLGEVLQQEGYALANAGDRHFTLEPDDLDYTREILTPHLDSEHFNIQFAAVFRRPCRARTRPSTARPQPQRWVSTRACRSVDRKQ